MDFIDKINLVDLSRKYVQRCGRQQGKGARWTWRQRRGGHWHQSQPDYCAWQETQAYEIFGTWRFGNPSSMTQTIGLSSRPFKRGRLVNSSNIARAAKPSPCNSPQCRSRMSKRVVRGIEGATCEEDAKTRRTRNDWISEE